MLAADADAETPEELRRRYATALETIVDEAGEDHVRDEAGVDAAAIDAIRDGTGDIELADAAAILAVDDDRSADAIVAEVRDALLLDMSSAVLDVEAIAADVAGLDPGEVQAKIEGRYPMTLGEYAELRYRIDQE